MQIESMPLSANLCAVTAGNFKHASTVFRTPGWWMRGERYCFATVTFCLGSWCMPAQITAVHIAVPFGHIKRKKQNGEYLKGVAVAFSSSLQFPAGALPQASWGSPPVWAHFSHPSPSPPVCRHGSACPVSQALKTSGLAEQPERKGFISALRVFGRGKERNLASLGAQASSTLSFTTTNSPSKREW